MNRRDILKGILAAPAMAVLQMEGKPATIEQVMEHLKGTITYDKALVIVHKAIDTKDDDVIMTTVYGLMMLAASIETHYDYSKRHNIPTDQTKAARLNSVLKITTDRKVRDAFIRLYDKLAG